MTAVTMPAAAPSRQRRRNPPRPPTLLDRPVSPVTAVLQEFERFWSQVRAETEAGCWLWEGPVNGGYALFRWSDGRLTSAHRYAFEVSIGPLPRGIPVGSWCGVGLCVNPWHAVVEPRADRHAARWAAFGAGLRELRFTRGETQQTVADRAGIGLTTYRRLESGRNRPQARTLTGLAVALGVPRDEFVRLLASERLTARRKVTPR
jgi:DNA-binding XRE family transcriptional regulator